jgi:citrate synthase
VVWKHLVAQAYWDILDLLRRDGAALADFDAIRFAFLKSFNSQHDVEALCRPAEQAAAQLVAALRAAGRAAGAAAVAGRIDEARRDTRRALGALPELRQVDRGPSYVTDGLIMIAGAKAEEFAARPDYLEATLQLIGEEAPEVAARARAAWQRGFVLDDGLQALVRSSAEAGWEANDLLAEVLMREQRSGAYPSLREHEFVPARPPAANRAARLRAIDEGYFLLGRLMSCVSLMCPGSAPLDAGRLDGECPVGAALAQAGVPTTPATVRAFRRFMLVRCAHGLNPGEFTARIAASVRTSFPQALIASLMVRAGKVHAGALAECMKQLDAWLAASSRDEFVAGLLRADRLYGFGHRIHKRPTEAGEGALGGDPRVAFLVEGAREAFPAMAGRIAAMEGFAHAVRRLKPSLSPNTDFGAAIWFSCLGLDPRVGSAFFSLSRMPGLIAQVIGQLDCKANSLRPPLAVNLPYPY